MRQELTRTVAGERHSRVTVIACAGLGLAATLISVLMAVKMAAATGGDRAEQVVWGAFGVVVILAAHWLPALSRHAGPGARCAAWALWAASMAYATYSHSSYFVLTQQAAGLRRADAVIGSQEERAPSRRRALSEILGEQTAIYAEDAKLGAQRCQDCRWLRDRRAVLRAKLSTLHAEAEESKRDQTAREQVERLRQERRGDPVTSALSSWLGRPAWLELIPALLFSAILDGLAGLCWLLALQRREAPLIDDGPQVTPVTALRVDASGSFAQPVTASTAVPTSSTPPVTGQASDFDALVSRARDAVTRGHLRPTVRAIREFLGCSQASASKVHRAVKSWVT